MAESKFRPFILPVDRADAPDYYDVVQTPMDLDLVCAKLDRHDYHSVDEIKEDIEQIVVNAEIYHPRNDPLRHVARAKAMQDEAYLLLDETFPRRFLKRLRELSLLFPDHDQYLREQRDRRRRPLVERQRRLYYQRHADRNANVRARATTTTNDDDDDDDDDGGGGGGGGG
eukprot:CAMPEP_0198331718 /NCGR_PEP_ID=MMETSP1450-20131203/17772_1 /TAXON_ID=753684 ORGANISM="Madagascaria erythrocladiodes, Strain CCMP3234" /NCGR_SAMPLE_ID=MMETSP1450 /ASSEMBLY_ACC=CAM_ASM_001115 /LENGTH=170 /DNA_ID=CAMNT_0044036125 /DNA_START=32 /DNA_END=541 /DNA_ORIENTATION=+